LRSPGRCCGRGSRRFRSRQAAAGPRSLSRCATGYRWDGPDPLAQRECVVTSGHHETQAELLAQSVPQHRQVPAIALSRRHRPELALLPSLKYRHRGQHS
jgi:hypothetical protein